MPKASDDVGHRRRFGELLEKAKKESAQPADGTKQAQAEQSKAFVKAARELGTDEDPEAFDRMLKKITKAPPPKSVQKRKGARPKK